MAADGSCIPVNVSRERWIDVEIEVKQSMPSYLDTLDEELSHQPGVKKAVNEKESFLVLWHLERQINFGVPMCRLALDHGYETGAVYRGAGASGDRWMHSSDPILQCT